MDKPNKTENFKELRTLRRLLIFAGTVYFLWWFAVESLLPGAFNPFPSRALVAGSFFLMFLLSYIHPWSQKNLRLLMAAGLWFITLHYFYLFYSNGGDINWIIGAYITILAISFYFISNAALLSYSVFILVVSTLLLYLMPSLRTGVFFPGLLTIIIQANIGFRSRLGLIKTLADSNDRFQLLFNSTFEGVLVHEKGRIVNINTALTQLIGFSESELIGKNLIDFVHPDEKNQVTEKMNLSEVPPYETRIINKNGTALDIEVRVKDFSYDGQTARLVTMQDLTARKRAEKDKIVALTMAENVRLRDEFISIASHELKTPISSLKLQTQLIERDLRRQTENFSRENLSEFLALFNRQVNRLLELVETMLDVSRISSGRLILTKGECNLPEIINDVITTLHVKSKITVEAPAQLIIRADCSRLKQVMENLLTNALKYGDNKPTTVKIRTEAAEAIISIEDQGLGIAPEYIERIFNRFERAISAQNISGLGLGLYITRQIVEAHGGTITVKSEIGQGSIFTVRLPLG